MPIYSWRTTLLPPKDRAYWRPSSRAARGPLLYLAWGARHFGAAPIAPTLHDGWVYSVLEKGSPLLVREKGQERITAPALLIIGPDCASGWSDSPRRLSRMLVWVWRKPRHSALARLNPAGHMRFALGKEDLALLGNLHALTRLEAQQDDANGSVAIRGLQLVIEAHLAQIVESKSVGSEDRRVKQSLEWLEGHLDSRQPLARLADYLGVSPSSVQRLFREKFQMTVNQVMMEIRCHEAARMIAEEGAMIKTVAYRLGYRHPYDFTRAYRRTIGSNPSILRGQPRGMD